MSGGAPVGRRARRSLEISLKKNKNKKSAMVTGSLGDPDPESDAKDPQVFGPPRSGSISQRCGSGDPDPDPHQM